MEDVRLQEKIKAFLSVDHGYGDGDGYGYGDGYGDGDGDGDGYGDGYGDGDGDGYGDGYGDGIGQINGMRVHRIDDVQTIITSVKGNVAKGFILQSDLTLTPCYVVKGNANGRTVFAHGNDLHKAITALTDKLFDDMPEEERISEFIKAHPEMDKPYPNQDLFDWHHRLTGSCMAGRSAFVKDRDLTLDGETTVTEFIKLTQNAYGGSVIRNLEKAYQQKQGGNKKCKNAPGA